MKRWLYFHMGFGTFTKRKGIYFSPPQSILMAQEHAIYTLYLLEKHFSTSTLSSQVHLLVHIVNEVEIVGVVHTCWMFFLERFMKFLKGFVRQKTQPEGFMAKGWLVQESCVFIREYLVNANTNIPMLWST